MASLLNNASLLLNPAGSIISYQEDKIYSVLPKDGTGDFTFSGGDGGTRVNQQGYIEQTPANFMLNSGTTWGVFNVTVTTGVTDPVGGTGAYTIGSIASGNITEYAFKSGNAMSLPAGTVITFSLYMKGSGTIATYLERSISGTYWFNVKVHTLSSEWQVFTHSYTVPTDASGVTVYVGNSTGTTATSVDVAFPMVNYGSTARPYQPTTDRLNYPRITYQNGRGALLSEPQRTNLWLQSQNFSNAGATYGLFRLTLTQNAGISPDGTSNAVRWVDTATTGQHQLEPFFTAVSGQSYTVSVFVKAAERTQFHIFAFADNGVFNNTDAFYDVAAGTVISGTGASIEKWPNGWYRCIRTMTAGATGIGYWGVGPAVNGAASYAGDTNSGILVWGGQNEAGEFASTYIPTTSATVTRPLDTFYKIDSPALNTTSWTFYMSGVNIGKNQNASNNNIDAVNWSFDSGGGPYGPNSIHNYNNTIYYYDTVNGAAFLASIGNTTTKFAVTKNGTTFKVFRNGVLASTNTLSLASNVWDSFRMYGDVDAQGQAFSNNPSTLAILPSALSDAEAQSLTTVRSGSGGTISYYGPYTVHTFTGSATFTPSFSGQVEVLVVAGGGAGGGGDVGGGGGAGGLLYVSSYGVSQGTGITVTVGAGGAGVQNASLAGGNGSNSVFGGLTAIGGGGGAGWTKGTGNDGGSGGGATYNGVGGKGIPGQGNDGGTGGVLGTPYPQCGGGGAGQIGLPATGSTIAGNGGAGLPYSISGFSTYYAGGGGGATEGTVGTPGTPGTGGIGGGGNGGSQGASILGTPGVNGLGGGGGGCDPQAGASGGSGIVIVRYLT
jgi:hypothetical protein